MSISTQEVTRVLHPALPENQSRALEQWMTAVRADLKALLAKLDADSGVTGEDYASTIKNTGD